MFVSQEDNREEERKIMGGKMYWSVNKPSRSGVSFTRWDLIDDITVLANHRPHIGQQSNPFFQM